METASTSEIWTTLIEVIGTVLGLALTSYVAIVQIKHGQKLDKADVKQEKIYVEFNGHMADMKKAIHAAGKAEGKEEERENPTV